MYVKHYMTKNVVTIDYDATISEAVSLMEETNVHRIPVMKGDKLVGIITDGNIQKASPSKATSLSIHEINYLLSKCTVADYMTKNVVTCSADLLLEEAVEIMKTKKVSCLPVLEDGKLTGIITETDMFEAFTDLLGFNEKGSSRITVDIREDKLGVLARLTSLTKASGVNIINVGVYREQTPLQVVIRVNSLEIDGLLKALADDDFKVSHVLKNE
ncbi:MAG: CBS domain-containing protein [Erysipelotrichales bacterium]|nr:CBS domain-containing protein [Erysipelotrichales bacterium]